jgi:hypothetical protein
MLTELQHISDLQLNNDIQATRSILISDSDAITRNINP